eukprot:Sro1536_g280640.2  (416) ;mRNA; r:20736-21983
MPLVAYARDNHETMPHADATRPAKELVLQVYYREIWQIIGSFDEINNNSVANNNNNNNPQHDNNGDDDTDMITKEQLGLALAKKFEIDPSDEFVSDTLSAFDANGDGCVTRDEYNACMRAIQLNRFDLSPQECTGIRQVTDTVQYLNTLLSLEERNDPRKADLMNNGLQVETKKAGEVILQQGDTDNKSLYFVEDGTVEFIADGKSVGECGKGGSFGELSLLYDSPRAATCKASSDCRLWKVDRPAFRHLLVQSANQQNQKIRSVVLYLTKALEEPSERVDMQDLLEMEQFESGTVILEQGDAGDCLYFCEAGTVQFSSDGKDLGMCGPGGSFGELALWYDSPRAATCTAISDCRLWRVDRTAFRRLLERAASYKPSRRREEAVADPLSPLDIVTTPPLPAMNYNSTTADAVSVV